MLDLLTDNYVAIKNVSIGGSIGVGVISILLGLFARFKAKAKIIAWSEPKSEVAGLWFSKLLTFRFGLGIARTLEDKLFDTVLDAIEKNFAAFRRGMHKDDN